jgi:hypothetical protein
MPLNGWIVIAVGLAAALGSWAIMGNQGADDGSGVPAGSDATPAVAPPPVMSADALRELTRKRTAPVYWAGERKGVGYGVSQRGRDDVLISYLPRGTPAADRRRALTVGTYRLPNAFAAIRRAARVDGAEVRPLPSGGRVVLNRRRPTNAYFAYPGSTVQVEVFDPVPRRALRLVLAGRVRPVPRHTPTAARNQDSRP